MDGSSSTQRKDTTPTRGCPYCGRQSVGENCPWCGEQSVCDLCRTCWTDGCDYEQPSPAPEVEALLSERGAVVRELGRRIFLPLPDALRERGV